jgi:hypothetical protein
MSNNAMLRVFALILNVAILVILTYGFAFIHSMYLKAKYNERKPAGELMLSYGQSPRFIAGFLMAILITALNRFLNRRTTPIKSLLIQK